MEKTLNNTTANQAKTQVSDIQFWGDGDTFKLISKASSKREGWMKSTKAMQTNSGVVIQVTTQLHYVGKSTVSVENVYTRNLIIELMYCVRNVMRYPTNLSIRN